MMAMGQYEIGYRGRWTEPLRRQSREVGSPFDEDQKAPSHGGVLISKSQAADLNQEKKQGLTVVVSRRHRSTLTL